MSCVHSDAKLFSVEEIGFFEGIEKLLEVWFLLPKDNTLRSIARYMSKSVSKRCMGDWPYVAAWISMIAVYKLCTQSKVHIMMSLMLISG